MEEKKSNWKLVTVIVIAAVAFIVGLCFAIPTYRVWSSRMEGKAELEKAEQNRNILIKEAQAHLEAEKLNAQAEIERAKGAAEAIHIENGSITDSYIKYLWVRQQKDLNQKTVVYIPTGDFGIPIIEAGRLNEK